MKIENIMVINLEGANKSLEDKKDKIEPLKYEDFAEIREYGKSCMYRFFHDGIVLSQEGRKGKDLYKVITYQEKAKIDKINEIIKWINESGE